MIERSYKNGEFKAERHSFHIYCTVCDFLIIIHENTIECANKYLNECITKSTKKHLAYSNPIRKNMKKEESISILSSNEINRIFINYSIYPSRNYYTHNMDYEFRKRITYFIFNSIKVIQ